MSNKSKAALKNETGLKAPSMFSVTMHNDDHTTMDFVTLVLMKVFNKSSVEASKLMMEVHIKGKSIVGVYTYDVAITKKMQTNQMAFEKGFPLRISVDEVV